MDLDRFKKTIADGEVEKVKCEKQMAEIIENWKKYILAKVNSISDAKLDDELNDWVDWLQYRSTFLLHQNIYIFNVQETRISYDDGETISHDLWDTAKKEIPITNGAILSKYHYPDYNCSYYGNNMFIFEIKKSIIEPFLQNEVIPKIQERLEEYGLKINKISLSSSSSRFTIEITAVSPLYKEND